MNTSDFLNKRYAAIAMEAVTLEKFPSDLHPIIELFIEDAVPNMVSAGIDYAQNLIIRSENNELMLRLRAYDGYIVIARIEFAHQRSGFMSRLEAILLDLARELNLKGIRIECANAPSIIAYVQKHKYVPNPYIPSDYLLNVLNEEFIVKE